VAVPFKPPFWPSVAAVAFIGLTVVLGNWQLDRAHQKTAIYEAAMAAENAPPVVVGATLLEPQAVAYRHVKLHGHYVPESTVYIDNRMVGERVGFYVITALVPEGGGPAVSVNRGWWPRDPADREHVDAPAPASGEIDVEGKAVVQVASYWNLSGLGADKDKGLWLNFTLDGFAGRTGLVLQPFVVQQTTESNDGLIRHWDAPDAGANKHFGYAVQWFGLAAVALVVWLRAGIRGARAASATTTPTGEGA